MLSYQHAYHAGNFADVHKHIALYGVVTALHRKDSAITLVDTHAGRGLYPLADAASRKTGEYEQGIARLWQARADIAPDTLLGRWMAELTSLQDGTRLAYYPGSPWWLATCQRKQDDLSLFELHPGEHQALESQTLAPGKRGRRMHGDGLAGLKKMLPVATPRLCVLIDPSYEVKTEYRDVAKALRQTAAKARHAVIALWYPILAAPRHKRLLDSLAQSGTPKLWHSELRLPASEAGQGMRGSGVVLLNAPWQLDRELDITCNQVARLLGAGADHRSAWLTGE